MNKNLLAYKDGCNLILSLSQRTLTEYSENLRKEATNQELINILEFFQSLKESDLTEITKEEIKQMN